MTTAQHHPCGAATPHYQMSRRDILKLLGGSAIAMLSAAGFDPVTARSTGNIPRAGTHFPLTQVAVAQTPSYDPPLVRRQVQTILDNLGGIADIVRPGDRVAIKVNLTGGTKASPLPNTPPIESYVTHPQVVQALGELLRDAGASRLYIVEGIVDARSYADWGYLSAAQAIDATLIDLNSPEPYSDFGHVPVGPGWAIYQNFTLNHLLEEVDAFISVAKMKCHWWAGITLSMKNLVGVAPVGSYNSSPLDLNRSAFHGDERITGQRLPNVIMDLNQARPIDLALIDGIQTVEGGEGPWQATNQVNAGVLLAGKNAVATDAVAMAVMGFDPETDMPNPPFLRGTNHLNLARALGLGTNRLSEIEILGTPISAIERQFRPCYSPQTLIL